MTTAAGTAANMAVDTDLHKQFIQSRGLLGVQFRVARPTADLTDLFLDRLSQLEAFRPGTGISMSARVHVNREAVADLFTRTEAFLEEVKTRTYVCLQSKQKRRLAEARHRQCVLRLQLEEMKDVFQADRTRPEALSPAEQSELHSFLSSTCEGMLGGLRYHPLTPERVNRAERMYRGLSDTYKKDRQLILDAIANYRAACIANPGKVSTPPRPDPVKARIEELYTALTGDQSSKARLLLSDFHMRDLFTKQVVRDGLDIKVFFEHPLVADFLRGAESVERSVRMAGDSIEVGKSGLPEILFDGKVIPVKDLPGYKDSFQNLHGWRTLGLSATGDHCPVHKASERAEFDDMEGYVYTKHMGLIPFNPRTWSHRTESGWKPVDLDQAEWWTQLPPYRTEEVEVESEADTGWRLEWLVSHTDAEAQFADTHAFGAVIIPLDEVHDGKVRVGYYPFGMFAYLFDMKTILAPIHKELHYIDQNLHQTRRGFTSYQKVVSKQEAHAALEQIRRERLESIQESRGEIAPTFHLGTNNCATAVRRTASASCLENDFPLAIPSEGLAAGIYRIAIKILMFLTPLRRFIYKLLGAREVDLDWDMTVDSTFTMRMFLQLRKETEKLHSDVEALARQRIHLIPRVSW